MASNRARAALFSNANLRADSRLKGKRPDRTSQNSSNQVSSLDKTSGSVHKLLATPSQEKSAIDPTAHSFSNFKNADLPHPAPPVTIHNFIIQEDTNAKKTGSQRR